jgi:hypothetical protein
MIVSVLALVGLSSSARALSDPDDFCTGNPCIIASDETADAGAVLDFGARAVILTRTLTVGDLPSGDVGSLTILAGTFSITSDGQIKGNGGSNAAGTVYIVCGGDIQLDGSKSTGTVRLTGADAGSLYLTSGGTVSGTGKINLDHDGLIDAGGTLLIDAVDIDISGDIIAGGGNQSFGGSVDAEAVNDISLTGFIDINGGDGGGGFLDVFAGGSVVMGAVDMSGSGDVGDAGLADISAIGSVAITDLFKGNGADNGENCGDAGDLDITADADITINGELQMKGRGLDCAGGFLALDGFNVVVNDNLEFSGTGSEGAAGDIDISAFANINIAGDIKNDGGEDAGDIVLFADGDIIVTGDLIANGRGIYGAGASLIELDAFGTVQLSSHIDARGGSLGIGGDVVLDGCKVITTATAVIEVTAAGGLITVIANDDITLAGQFVGEPTSVNAIQIRYGPNANPPNVAAATFNVAPTLILNPLIPPCSLCDGPEECVDGNPCTDDVCVPATGCQNPPNFVLCDDDDLCTTVDICINGGCLGLGALDCSDGNVCTDDICLPASGCDNPPNNDPCDDGDLCTTEQCGGGACIATPMNCEDGNNCTDNPCIAGVCQSIDNTDPCNDGDLCTTSDQCSGGACAGVPIDCEDGNNCTDNSCVAGVCQSIDNTDPCNDADLCTTGDQCSGGTCLGASVDCEDGNVCTDNSCVAGVCQTINNTDPCDDLDGCSTNDTCDAGACLGGPPPNCDDSDPCTSDTCPSTTGCENAPIIGCSDGDGDGIIDTADACTTLDWSASPQAPPNQNPGKLKLTIKGLSEPAGEQDFQLKGFFNVAAPAQTVAPQADGIHLRVADSAGVFYEINIPGGLVGEPQQCGSRDGWAVVSGSSSRWKYTNKTGALPPGCVAGSARGISIVQISDKRGSGKSALQLKLKAKDGDFDHMPVVPVTLMQADLALAAQPAPGVASQAAIDGQCIESVIAGNPVRGSSPKPFCKVKPGKTINCKGL